MVDRWLERAPIDVIPDEATFDWFVKRLSLDGRVSGTNKGKAVVSIMEAITWEQDGVAAYIVVGACRALMQFEMHGQTAEIVQLATAPQVRGAAALLVAWLLNQQHATAVQLMPTPGSRAAYQALGFVVHPNADFGGYFYLDPGTSAYWARPGGAWGFMGPPPPPPADDAAPPPPPPPPPPA